MPLVYPDVLNEPFAFKEEEFPIKIASATLTSGVAINDYYNTILAAKPGTKYYLSSLSHSGSPQTGLGNMNCYHATEIYQDGVLKSILQYYPSSNLAYNFFDIGMDTYCDENTLIRQHIHNAVLNQSWQVFDLIRYKEVSR